MTRETTATIAKTLVDHCNNDTTNEALDQLYDKAAISVEAMAMPGTDSPETKGLDGIKAKHEWWYSNFEVHSHNAEGPFLHGDDRFGVIFTFDATNKQSGDREAMKELAIYTVANGKIIREEFFYGEG